MTKVCNACTGRDGEFKQLYTTMEEAKHIVELRYHQDGVKLSIYFCPYYDGWHLTKG